MMPAGSSETDLNKDIYILTLRDDTIYDSEFNNGDVKKSGPYFKVTKTSTVMEHSDAYEVDIGYPSDNIVTAFQVTNNENYSIFYDWQGNLSPEQYVRRLNGNGKWEDVYAPTTLSKNDYYVAKADDKTWWTKLTKYPVGATITIQGLLRPATLMTYLRLNVIFPGGAKHISSGLYIITAQEDTINDQGYKTTLKLTRINGD